MGKRAVKNHSERKHSKFAASSAKQWIPCPGSVELCERAPKRPDSDASKEGTTAHEWLEILVRYWLEKGVGAKPPAFWLKDCPEYMQAHLIESAKVIFKLRPSPEAELHIETRVTLDHIHDEAFGTLDYCWVEPWGLLVVIDFKYGRWTVLPANEDGSMNEQLGYYAVAIASKHGYDFSEVKLAIVQPKVHSDDEEPVFETIFNLKALLKLETKIQCANP